MIPLAAPRPRDNSIPPSPTACRVGSWHDARLLLLESARQALGTKFVHQGRVNGKGLDCVGLVRHPLIALELTGQDFHAYKMVPNPLEMERHLNTYFEPIPTHEADIADIFWLRVQDDPVHLAIWSGPEEDTIIHAAAYGPQCVIEHAFRYPWPQRLYKVYRYRQLGELAARVESVG